MTTSHNTRQHFALIHVHSGAHGPEVTVTYTRKNLKWNNFRHGLKIISLNIGLDNGSEEKIWEYISFPQLFGMACKLPVALNTDMQSIAFRYSTFIISFLTSCYIVSKRWPTSEWEKKSLFFFTRKFRQRLDSEGEVVTFKSWHDAIHCLTHVWRITRVT